MATITTHGAGRLGDAANESERGNEYSRQHAKCCHPCELGAAGRVIRFSDPTSPFVV